MPYVLVEDFRSGLDTRRTNVTSVPGSLLTLTNAHITRGGEIEKRRAFVELADLPSETEGLAAAGGQIYVFGTAEPSDITLPSSQPNLNYVQIRHPNLEAEFQVSGGSGDSGNTIEVSVGATNLLNTASVTHTGDDETTADAIVVSINAASHSYEARSFDNRVIVRGQAASVGDVFTLGGTATTSGATSFQSVALTEVLSVDFFDGDPYVVAQYADGRIYHYWVGQTTGVSIPINRIADWFDSRARNQFVVTNGTDGGTAASGSFDVTGGSSRIEDVLRTVRVNNVQLFDTTVSHTGVNSTTATAVAEAINAKTSVPNYTATAVGNTVTITAEDIGVAANGYEISFALGGNFTTGSVVNMTGGVDNAITSITVGGKEVLGEQIKWQVSNEDTAERIAAQVNSFLSSPNLESSAVGSTVNLVAEDAGIELNGSVIVITTSGDVETQFFGSPLKNTMAEGSDPALLTSYSPGKYARAFRDQMHSVSGSVWHFSAIADPSEWNSGAASPSEGLINLSNNARGSERLLSIANYFNNLAVFAEQAVQIWFKDPDPANDTQVQVLNNTGTIAGKSVVEFGDSDVFYLSFTGIRSLRARDSSNAAFVGDIGNPIDELVIEEIQSDERTARKATGILSPRDGRYLLALGEKVYVFSYFPGSKVSAWSIYEPGFAVEFWAWDGRQVLCRAGNTLYSLGGINNDQFDDSTVTVQMPFLDAKQPATVKLYHALDAVLTNDWRVYISTDPSDIEINEEVATINQTTYALGNVSISARSTHIALKLVCESDGPAKLGNVAVHFDSGEVG
jgi:hypothetical protein